MTQALVKQSRMKEVRDLIAAQREQIAMALPRHLDADRLSRIAVTAIRKTPRLLECSPASLLGAVIQAAQLGLECDGVLGQAYLIPYKQEATLQIGYRGMIDLARRSGQIKSISARIVYEGDEFSYEFGLEEKLRHIPAQGDRGNPVYAYAVAQLTGGGHAMEVLSLEEIKHVQKSSKSGNIWRDHWDAMARKTAIRRLFKYLPVSVEINRGLALDEQGEQGLPQHLGDIVTGEGEVIEEPEHDPTKEKEAELLERLEEEEERRAIQEA